MSKSNITIKWDTMDFDSKISKAIPKMIAGASKGVGMAGDELLRLSLIEVPFDTGHLQSTGNKAQKELEVAVSYNTPYAVKVHEHPEYHFKNGRKGKYLESPFTRNTALFNNLIKNAIQVGLTK